MKQIAQKGGWLGVWVVAGVVWTMPKRTFFSSEAEYYSTFFHEIVHSTGHHTRLNRLLGTGKKTKAYAKEELVAEFGALFLTAEIGAAYHTLENSAAYIKGWKSRLIDQMNKDNKFFIHAVSQAKKAADYILQRNSLHLSRKHNTIRCDYLFVIL